MAVAFTNKAENQLKSPDGASPWQSSKLTLEVPNRKQWPMPTTLRDALVKMTPSTAKGLIEMLSPVISRFVSVNEKPPAVLLNEYM